jgi:DNA-binding CsgD family transcriptional regulator
MENLKRLVFPYMELLGHTKLEEEGREYMNLISAHLHSLMDSFCRRLDDPSIGLTPKELLVADMVKKGKSSAEIAKLLNLTIRTVEVYRNIIRKKLKISGKKINLHVYLQKKFL